MLRTDIAAEAHEMSMAESAKVEGVISNTEYFEEISVTTVEILNESGAEKIGKSIGKYITVEAMDLKYSADVYEKTCSLISKQIKSLVDFSDINLVLVAGLGNDDITPDSLGTGVSSQIMVTHHMKKYAPHIFGENIRSVCAIAPGVLGTTGMESADIIKSIASDLKPDLVIVVDALAAADYKRIGNTVQLSDAGIQPGAGVGNNRCAINKNELGVPVIAIGVPTVVDARTILNDENNNDMEPYIVTPRDIDLIIKKCAKTVSNGINLALQDDMSLREIEEYVG